MSPQDRSFLLPGAGPSAAPFTPASRTARQPRALTRTIALAGGVLLVASAGRAGAQITSCDVSSPTTNGTSYSVGTGQSCTTLAIDNTTLTQTASGVLNALNGGVVLLNGGTIAGGTLSTSGTGVIRATNNGNNTLSGVTLAGTVDVTNNVQLRIRDGLTFGSGGNIQVANGTYLSFTGTQILGGTGTVVFGAGGSSLSIDGVDGSTPVNLTVGPNVTIRGQNGTIGQAIYQGTSGGRTLTNNGTIQADVAGGTITITDLTSVTNNGTLAALNGGTLNLQTGVVGGANAQILAGDGSTVLLNGVTVSGQVNTTGTGALRATNNGANTLNGVTLNGTVDVGNNVQLRVRNGLTLQNNSTVLVNNGTYLGFTGTQTIGGAGAIVLGAGGSSLSIDGIDGSTPVNLTVGPNVTIRGQNATIGQAIYQGTSGGRTLTNNGTIQADVAGGTITITDLTSVTNNGTLAALNGGTLNLQTGVVGGANAQILAGNGSTVLLNGVTVSGQVNTTGTGALRATNNGANTLNGVTLNGTVDVGNNVQLRIANGLTMQNSSTILVNNGTYLGFTGTQTIGGAGSIVLGAGGSSLSIDGIDGSTAANVTIGSNVTIRGQNATIGQAIYQGTSGGRTLTNQGLILANGDGVAGSGNTGTITLTQAAFVNTGTFRADGAGNLLDLQSAGVTNAGGTIDARNGAVVRLDGATITGGTLTTSGGGTVQATNNGANTLSGVTLAGTVDVTNDVQLRVRDGLTFGSGGTINTGNGTYLSLTGTQTISGTGSINFGAGGSTLSIDGIDGSSPANVTLGPNVTIQGANGTIGQALYQGTSGGRTLTNNGTINANGGGTITVTDLTAVVNNGTLRAQNGTLSLNTPLSGTGTLQVDAAGTLTLNAGQTNVAQGTLAIGGAGATLNNGATNITLSTDYTNASAGTGNSFNRRAGITGTGLVLAAGDVSQTITGAGVTNGASNTAATLTIGNVRVGANAYTYNIAEAGTNGPALRGAIQTSVNGASITDSRLSGSGVTASNYGPVTRGAPQAYTVTFTAGQAGGLAPLNGQVVNLNSAYSNIGDANGNQKLNIVLGSGAAAYQVAQGQLNTPALNFGTVQVGQSISQTLSLTNTASGPAGYVEDLNARFGTATDGRISGTGNITGLSAGSTNASNLVVSVNTSSAGSINGAIRVNYYSAGTVNGTSNGLGELGVGGSDYGVQGTIQAQGNVVDQARPVINNAPVNLGATRVGGTLAGAVSVTNQATGNQQAALDASFGATSGVTASGSVNLLTPGATDNSSLRVALNTATAGTLNGSATVNFVSDAGNIGGCGANCQLSIGSQNVSVTGKVYTAAVAQVNTSTVDFGIVHVGDNVAARGVSVTNAAAQSALNDGLAGGIGTSSTGFTASGTLGSGVAAGATNTAGLTVGLNTGASGRYTGTAAVALASHDADLTDLALGTTNVSLVGQVNNYAQGDFSKTGGLGAFSQQTASAFTLDFGTVLIGSGNESANLAVDNVAQGFADFLNGSFAMTGSGFAFGGFNPFTNVGAGGSFGGLTVSFTPGTAGSFSEVVTLNDYGTNASGYRGDLGPVTLTLRASVGSTVTTTPRREPGTWALLAAGLGGVGLVARRRRRTTAAA